MTAAVLLAIARGGAQGLVAGAVVGLCVALGSGNVLILALSLISAVVGFIIWRGTPAPPGADHP